jgi:coenzyme PQQ biosynthesis protein C
VTTLMSARELEAALRDVGARRYHNHHPFHRMLHSGELNREQVKAWALNRYYYQSMIPIKDATLLARLPTPELRRIWRERIIDHDGGGTAEGGISKWLRLTQSLGFSNADVEAGTGILPATRFAVEAYVHFVRDRTLLEAIASSLTEMFSPQIISDRVKGMLASYPFISEDTLAYFDKRPVQAARDVDFALGYCLDHARAPEQQRAVIAALEFKCDVLWAQLDALYHAYVVPAHPPPGTYQLQDGS